MSRQSRLNALEAAGLTHQRPDAVTAPLFNAGISFFLAADKVQVKYEMLRAHIVDGLSVSEAAKSHGYSRPSFYLVRGLPPSWAWRDLSTSAPGAGAR